MDIKIKLQGFDQLYSSLDSQQAVRAAAYRAINRTVDGVVTDISTEVRKVYTINKVDVDKRLYKAPCDDYYNLQGAVYLKESIFKSYESRAPLIMFGAVDRRNLAQGSIKTMKGKAGFYSKRLKRKVGQEGVSYKVLKSGGKGFSSNAFIIPGGKGSLQVVRRKPGQKGRFALEEKRVISVAGMIMSRGEAIMSRIEDQARQRMAVNFDREWRYYQDRVVNGQVIGGLKSKPK